MMGKPTLHVVENKPQLVLKKIKGGKRKEKGVQTPTYVKRRKKKEKGPIKIDS